MNTSSEEKTVGNQANPSNNDTKEQDPFTELFKKALDSIEKGFESEDEQTRKIGFSQAYVYFESCLKLDQNQHIKGLMAFCLTLMGKFKEAITEANKILVDTPNEPCAHVAILNTTVEAYGNRMGASSALGSVGKLFQNIGDSDRDWAGQLAGTTLSMFFGIGSAIVRAGKTANQKSNIKNAILSTAKAIDSCLREMVAGNDLYCYIASEFLLDSIGRVAPIKVDVKEALDIMYNLPWNLLKDSGNATFDDDTYEEVKRQTRSLQIAQ